MHIATMKDSYLYINILPVRYWHAQSSFPSTEVGLHDSFTEKSAGMWC